MFDEDSTKNVYNDIQNEKTTTDKSIPPCVYKLHGITLKCLYTLINIRCLNKTVLKMFINISKMIKPDKTLPPCVYKLQMTTQKCL